MGKTIAVWGTMFGPSLIVVARSNRYHVREDEALQEALGEADERFGSRIEPDDSSLQDYDGDTLEAKVESAVAAGDARYNDGGTLVWVDPYEWVRLYRSGHDVLEDLSNRSVSKCGGYNLKGLPVVVI